MPNQLPAAQVYETRQDETLAEKASWSKKLPLFMMNVVYFPGQPMHLHLFEPRYKLMIRRVLESGNRSFGYMCFAPREGAVGVLMEVRQCEFLADGRALLLAVSTGRFRIQQTWIEPGTEGLYYAKVSVFQDADSKSLASSMSASTTAHPIDMDGILTDHSGASMDSGVVPGISSTQAESSAMVVDDSDAVSAAGDTTDLDRSVSQSDCQSEDQHNDPARRGNPVSLSSHHNTHARDELNAQRALIAECRQKAHNLVESISDQARAEIVEEFGPVPSDPTALSFWLAALLPVPPIVKISLLQLTSAHERLQTLVQELRDLSDRVVSAAAHQNHGQAHSEEN